MRSVKYYKCPECEKKYKTLGGWIDHMHTMHPGSHPTNFTDLQYFYYTITGKTAGKCIECGSKTDWNEATGKYNRFCNNPKCKEKYVQLAKSRMVNKYGKKHLLNDPEQQKKMLLSKKISGYYAFSDGSGEVGYIGSYEKDFLTMLDKFMGYSANDIMISPHTYDYQYNGTTHFYMPDYYIPNLNLEVEIKTQENMHPKIQAVDKVKEHIKDQVMTNNKTINYLKINDKDYKGFFDYLLKLKNSIDESALDNKNIPELANEALDYDSNDYSETVNYDPKWLALMEGVDTSIEELHGSLPVDPINIIFVMKDAKPREVGYVTGYDEFSSIIIHLINHNTDDANFYSITPEYEGDGLERTSVAYVSKYSILDNDPNAIIDFTNNKNGYLMFQVSIDLYSYNPIARVLETLSDMHEPIMYNWDKCASDWINNSNKYHYFCRRLLECLRAKSITPNSSTDEFIWGISLVDRGILCELTYNRIKEITCEQKDIKPVVFEETLLEESGYYKELSPVLENLFYSNSFRDANEGYVVNKTDYKQNLSEIGPGNNILFITGFPGSGKSTLAKEYEAKGFKVFELDGIEFNYDTSNMGILAELKRRNPEYAKAIKRGNFKLEGLNEDSSVFIILRKSMMDVIKICQEDTAHRYVIEGVQLFRHMDPEWFKNKPLIVKGTSAITSYFRAAKRNKNFGNDPVPFIGTYVPDKKKMDNFEDGLKPANENYVFSKDDVIRNYNLWAPGKHNILFVIGHSGSGKTTLAKEYAEKRDKCAVIHLDGIWNMTADMSNVPDTKRIIDIIRTKIPEYNELYVNTNEDKAYVNGNVNTRKSRDIAFTKAMDAAVKICHQDKDHLYILEGIQIFIYLDPVLIRDEPLIVKGTSATKSWFRAMRRELKNKDARNFWYELLNYSSWSGDEKSLSRFSDIVYKEATESIQLHTNFDKVKIRGSKDLTKYRKVPLSQDVLDKYKEKCASFGHCRISNMSKGYVWVDKSDNIVGFVNVVTKPDNVKWIQALNLQPNYQGYGLYEQLLKVAVRELGGTDIETPPKNDTAREVYEKFGFKTYTDEESRKCMSIRADAAREKYNNKAKTNAVNMIEAGLYPIYVILTDGDTESGYTKIMDNTPYSQVALSFDSTMSEVYSFGSKDGKRMLPVNTTKKNLVAQLKSDPDARYVIYTKLISKNDYDKAKSKITELASSDDGFVFDMPGAVKSDMHDSKINAKRYFCTGFTSYILGSEINNNDDIQDIKNIHLVDMGLIREYNKNYIDKKVKAIYEKNYMHKEKDSNKQPINE